MQANDFEGVSPWCWTAWWRTFAYIWPTSQIRIQWACVYGNSYLCKSI